jgi:hypothetical protein
VILTDLLGARVLGPSFLGFVSDVRFVLDPVATDQPMPRARLYGIVVSPHARGSSLGFERRGVRSPWIIAAAVRWRHRGSFLVAWEDIERLDPKQVRLRAGLRRLSPELTKSAVSGPDFR